jgi:hypothetical protein
MLEITFRYSSTQVTPLTYNAQATQQLSFATVKCPDAILNTKEESGRMLNGRGYSNLLYSYRDIGDIIISADEVDSSVLAFFEAFWTAAFKYISIYGSGWGDYIEVLTEGGAFPLAYIDDIKDLKEITLKLHYTNPVS